MLLRQPFYPRTTSVSTKLYQHKQRNGRRWGENHILPRLHYHAITQTLSTQIINVASNGVKHFTPLPVPSFSAANLQLPTKHPKGSWIVEHPQIKHGTEEHILLDYRQQNTDNIYQHHHCPCASQNLSSHRGTMIA